MELFGLGFYARNGAKGAVLVEVKGNEGRDFGGDERWRTVVN